MITFKHHASSIVVAISLSADFANAAPVKATKTELGDVLTGENDMPRVGKHFTLSI